MEPEVKTKPPAENINKPAYVIFLVTGIIFMLLRDFSQAMMFWGLALVFDPFDVKQPFKERPLYQQLWLIVHLFITFALLGLMFTWK